MNPEQKVYFGSDQYISENINPHIIQTIFPVGIYESLLSYYGLLTREPFSDGVVWVDIVPKPVGDCTIPSQKTL